MLPGPQNQLPRSRPSLWARAASAIGRFERGVDYAARGVISDPKARKYEAIQFWDREATQRIKEGRYVRAFGNWTMMQLAKAHAESRTGLALDVLSLGSGGLLVKGVQSGARAVKGARMIKTARTMKEIDSVLKPIREGVGLTKPLAKTRHTVLAHIGRAAEAVETAAPKFIQPFSVAGTRIVTPRRALKVASKLSKGIGTEIALGKGRVAFAQPVTPPQMAAYSISKVLAAKAAPVNRARPVGPQSGSLPRPGQRPLTKPAPSPRVRPVAPASGSLLSRLGQELVRKPAPSLSPRVRPLAPAPGSLPWMVQGLNKPTPLLMPRVRPVAPAPGSLSWIAQGLNKPAPSPALSPRVRPVAPPMRSPMFR